MISYKHTAELVWNPLFEIWLILSRLLRRLGDVYRRDSDLVD
jgi:hypothetical protein